MKKHIPNIITSGNVLMGCLGILFVSEQRPVLAIICMILALVFDFADGLVARALKVSSDIGKELDSLADMITFGVLPGMMMYQMMLLHSCNGECTGIIPSNLLPYLGFMIPVFSAYRLAKFNTSTEQSSNFIGVPTPITAIFIGGIYYNGFLELSEIVEHLYHPKVLLVITMLVSFLLISSDKFIAFKIKKGEGIKKLYPELALVMISLVLIVVTGWLSPVYIYSTYVLISYVKFKYNN